MKIRDFISVFLRSFALQAVWNFERMQNIGFAYALLPALTALYPDPRKRTEALMRHLEFFNVHPYMVNIILGTVIRTEQEISSGNTSLTETVNNTKNAMAGPLAAIGDVFFWATFRPFMVLVAVGIMLAVLRFNLDRFLPLAPLFFIVVYNVIQIGFRLISFLAVYRSHEAIVLVIQNMKFQNMLDRIRFLGMATLISVMGFYFISYSRNMYDGTCFLLVFMGSIFMGSTKLPPAVVFYAVLLSGVVMYMIRGYG
ncbi:MAG: PTS system mannose/fructose/sorbose family transporter subunit IID [Elusimicrobia bacterium]|nr:PTS system mannose/fructose/sorbose family transporter subunit IID [Elusimicrobiota bacterium]